MGGRDQKAYAGGNNGQENKKSPGKKVKGEGYKKLRGQGQKKTGAV